MYRLKAFFQIACIIFLFVFTSPAKAQIFRINTINCKLNAEDLALLNKMGTFEAKFYNQVFGTRKNDSVTIDINLYGRHGEYNQVQKHAMNTTFIDGFYSYLENKIFIYKSDNYRNTLVHETSHNLLRYNYPNPPQWLNEGIATLLGYLVETTDNQIRYMPQANYIRTVRDSIRSGRFTIDNFFKYQSTDWFVEAKRPMLYATSYCIIYFLINLDKDCLAPILVLMKQGYSTQNAFKAVFGTLDKFRNQFYYFYTVGAGTHF